jgi:tripartite-type tricarboxylate transporter receptor subunit TctC
MRAISIREQVMDAFRVVVCAALVAMSFPGAAQQDYPNRSIRLIVPLAPGGGADLLARLVGQGLTERLARPVVVENRAGGGGHIGADVVAKAQPDGYTLMLGGIVHAIGMSLYKKLPYDMAKDLAPVIQGATFPSMILVHPSLPVHSIKELLALARSRPGALNYGAGTGSPNHLGIELLNVKMTFIPYKGAGPVVADLVAGHIHLASLGLPTALPHLRAGKLRVLAVTSATRSPQLPDVPTVSESGVPGYHFTSWYGVFAPAGTPREIIAKLNSESAATLKSPDVVGKLTALGAEVATTSPEEFGRIVREEIVKWAKVVQASGAKAE